MNSHPKICKALLSNKPRRLGRFAGFSVVELMVGLTLGLFLVGVAAAVFVASRQSLKVQDNSAHIQESARALIEDITKEVRRGASFGCYVPKQEVQFMVTATMPTGSGGTFPLPPVSANNFVHGGDVSALSLPGTSGVTRVSGTDYIGVQYGQPAANLVVGGGPNASLDFAASYPMNHSLTVAAGQPMIIADCNSATMFRVDDTGTVSTLNHVIGGANNVVPPDIVGSDPILSGNVYQTGTTIMWFQAPVFFVGEDGSGRRSLYRWDTSNSGGVQPMVPNVEQMQVVFGVDSASQPTQLNSVTQWLSGAAVEMGGLWQNVMAVSAHLVVRSDEELAIEPKNFVWDSSRMMFVPSSLASDLYVRQTYVVTATLRNRAPMINAN